MEEKDEEDEERKEEGKGEGKRHSRKKKRRKKDLQGLSLGRRSLKLVQLGRVKLMAK